MTATSKSRSRGKKSRARSGSSAFKPRARLLRIIGAELISDDVVAMTEIVKNAHDADAATVSIVFDDVTGDDGLIVISDDGEGMDLETLLGRWMQPAGSAKGRDGVRRTPGGRRYLGEKGVGRFAVDKLASRLTLTSRVEGSPDEVVARFDWDLFADDSLMLDEIECDWEVRRAETIKKHGTILELSGLRSRWTERMFRRLCSRLTRLISPLGDGDDFRIVVDSDDFPDYSGALKAGFLDGSPYRIDASFDGLSTVEFSFNGAPPVSMPWSGRSDLACGPVNIRLHAFDLETSSLARIGPRMEVRAWLREWSGISVYRDDFRVWPYGEPHDDWLRLDQRRVNNPVVRLSNNQIVGFVQITKDGNPDLRDQTNREGLINNRALDDLRRLMFFVLENLESGRQGLRHPKQRRKPGSTGVARESLESTAMERLDALGPRIAPGMRREYRDAVRELKDEMKKSVQSASHREESLVEMAAAGQAMEPMLESVESMAAGLEEQLERLRERLSDRGSARASRELAAGIGELRLRIEQLRPGTARTTQRRRSISVDEELERYAELVRPVLDTRGIDMRVITSGERTLRVDMRPETLSRLLQVFVTNSMDWLVTIERPAITLESRAETDSCRLTIRDNGPGLPRGVGEEVLRPLVSYREGGRGMGLALASIMVEQHRGSLSVDRDGRRRGAGFLITLPRRRSRVTTRV